MNTARLVTALILATTACAQVRQASPQHARLAQQVGVWDAAVEYVDIRTGKPARTTGTSVQRQPPGSFWLINNFEATLMGAPFRCMKTTGYDPVKKKLVGTWIDSMTPGMTVLEGSWDKGHKVMTMSGAGMDRQGRAAEVRLVTSILSEDQHVSEMFTKTQGGDETKTMTITYTRRNRKMDKVRDR